MIKSKFLVIFSTACILAGCNDDKKDDTADYDFTKILDQVGNTQTADRYSDLKTAAEDFHSEVAVFNASPTENNLIELQKDFKTLYLSWQNASVLNVGYAYNNQLKETFNTYPTDTAEIRTLINASSPNLEQISYIDATGLPGLDYLLFFGGNTQVLKWFNNAATADGSKYYLLKVAEILKNRAVAADNYWTNDVDGFKSKFVSDKSKAAGSSFSDLVNEFIIDFELMKNYQVGIPAGAFTPGITYPNEVEALYSAYSKELFAEKLKSLKNFYFGISASQVNGAGFDDYLTTVQAKRNGTSLNTLISDLFTKIETDLNNIDGTFESAVDNDQAVMNQLFLDMKLMTSYFKVDMISAFGIQITFADNDGD